MHRRRTSLLRTRASYGILNITNFAKISWLITSEQINPLLSPTTHFIQHYRSYILALRTPRSANPLGDKIYFRRTLPPKNRDLAALEATEAPIPGPRNNQERPVLGPRVHWSSSRTPIKCSTTKNKPPVLVPSLCEEQQSSTASHFFSSILCNH